MKHNGSIYGVLHMINSPGLMDVFVADDKPSVITQMTQLMMDWWSWTSVLIQTQWPNHVLNWKCRDFDSDYIGSGQLPMQPLKKSSWKWHFRFTLFVSPETILLEYELQPVLRTMPMVRS